MTATVQFLNQDFEYVPELGVSAYVREELVRDYTLVDADRSREFLYKRYSWSSAADGDFVLFREIPYGLASVSG